MTDSPGLFGHPAGPAQQSLFGEDANRLAAPAQTFLPDPEVIRRRLNALLDQARGAATMPWSSRDARMWQTIFPNMANWLPDEEANQLRLAFTHEIERLKTSA